MDDDKCIELRQRRKGRTPPVLSQLKSLDIYRYAGFLYVCICMYISVYMSAVKYMMTIMYKLLPVEP